jgi:hypothetical protein
VIDYLCSLRPSVEVVVKEPSVFWGGAARSPQSLRSSVSPQSTGGFFMFQNKKEYQRSYYLNHRKYLIERQRAYREDRRTRPAGKFGPIPRPIEWIETEFGCWNCTSHQGPFIYPIAWRDGKFVRLHRWLYEQCFGEIPDGIYVRHKCDNPKCINLEHLELGTPKQNTLDKKRHGTWQHGELHANHKLTWEIVRNIRNTYKLGNSTELCKKYGIDKSTVWKIVNRKSWNGVPE